MNQINGQANQRQHTLYPACTRVLEDTSLPGAHPHAMAEPPPTATPWIANLLPIARPSYESTNASADGIFRYG